MSKYQIIREQYVMKYCYIKERSNCHKIMEKCNFNENADLIKNLHNIQQSAQLSFQKLHFLFHYFPAKKNCIRYRIH